MSTAIEWFEGILKQNYGKEFTELNKQIFDKAKQMEKEQSHDYAKFAIECDRIGMKILNFDDWLKLEKNTFLLSQYNKAIGFRDLFLSEYKHVHQLQNLYFALTGEELELSSNEG